VDRQPVRPHRDALVVRARAAHRRHGARQGTGRERHRRHRRGRLQRQRLAAGDRYEAQVLRTLWPRAMPPLLAPKAVLGEHGGSTLAAAIAILHGHTLGAPPDGFEPDPDLGVAPHHGPLPRPRRLLVNAFATGGACAFAVLEGSSR
jgi:hypothetical protein